MGGHILVQSAIGPVNSNDGLCYVAVFLLPDFANCPKESSMKKSGRAPKTKKQVYGMRKTPINDFKLIVEV